LQCPTAPRQLNLHRRSRCAQAFPFGLWLWLDDAFQPFMRRAAAYIALKQHGLAVADLSEALKFEPRNKECHVKLQTIVETAIAGQQLEDKATNAELRRAGVRAAAIRSVREGWLKSAVRGNPGPAAVNGHTLFQGANKRIYLFGGRAVREQKPNLFVLDESDDSSWDIVPTRGIDLPHSRAWHSTAAIGGKESACYCVYGGVSSRGEDPQVHLLVPVAPRGFRWVMPRCPQDSKEIPSARSGHAAVAVVEDSGSQAVFIFGGRTKRGVSDQLLTLRCSSTPSSEDDGTVVWDEVQPHGREDSAEARSSWPAARDGHSMSLLPRTNTQRPRLVVFGGNGQLNDERMNDVWLFDLDEQLWTLLQCSGDIPPPRSYHTAHAIDEFLFVVGGRTAEAEDAGVYMLDIATCEWFELPIPSDRALTPRAWHSSVLTQAGNLFVLGGGTYHGPLRDAATLDLSTFRSQAALLSHASRQHFELE
jgi:hypothetical protein